MSVDAKCYEAISGAGLEPILQGGRGQASGFIMRMMAENKKKHQGQYRNPSDNNYGSTMNQFRPFNYKALANRDQNGRNTSDYGASPFIIKHFGSPQSVPFIPKAQRGSEEHRVIEGETDEQKSARLQAKAEELAEKAKELLEQAKQKGKVKEFLKGRVAVKRAKDLLQEKKQERDYRLEAERRRKEREDRKREEEEERKRQRQEKEDEEKRKRKEREDVEEANRKKGEEFEKELAIKDNELLLPILKEALKEKRVVVVNPVEFYDRDKQLKEHPKLGNHRENAELRFDTGYVRNYTPRRNYPLRYVEFSFPEYREALKKLKEDTLKLKEAGEESKIGYKGKYKHDDNLKLSGRETAWERKGTDLTERLGELGHTKERPLGYGSFGMTDTEPRPNAGFRTNPPSRPLTGMSNPETKKWFDGKMAKFYDDEDVPRMTKFLATIDKAIEDSDTDAKLTERTEAQIATTKANLAKLGKPVEEAPAPAPVKRKLIIKKPAEAPAPAQTAKPQKGATWEAVRAYINSLAGANKLERSVAMYRNLNMGKSEREIAKDTGVSQPSVNRWKTKFATD